jgi:hypothetical protein
MDFKTILNYLPCPTAQILRTIPTALKQLKYNPLQIEDVLPVATLIVYQAKAHEIDWALALAIAHQESTMGSSSTNVFQVQSIALKDIHYPKTVPSTLTTDEHVTAGIRYIERVLELANIFNLETLESKVGAYYAGVGAIASHGLDYVPPNNIITARAYAENVLKNRDIFLQVALKEEEEEEEEGGVKDVK